MKRLNAQPTGIAGLYVVVSDPVGDSRGALQRVFCADTLPGDGWLAPVAQANITRTQRTGTIRGLHFQQPPHHECKLVRCLRGEVWDVAVDLRRGSPTFLRWHAERLSPDNQKAMLIPGGCAHGLQTLCDDVDMLYFHSAPYAPDSEGGVNPFDERLKIAWPLPPGELSPRDRALPAIAPDFQGIALR